MFERSTPEQKLPVGSRVESSSWGAGQPRIAGVVLAHEPKGVVVVQLDDGTTRRRSARHLKPVAGADNAERSDA